MSTVFLLFRDQIISFVLSLVAEVGLAKKKQGEVGLQGESGREEEHTFPFSLTGGNWKSRGVEAEPLSGDIMSVTAGCLGPAKVIVDYGLEWFPNQSTEESEQVWTPSTLVPYSSLGLLHL